MHHGWQSFEEENPVGASKTNGICYKNLCRNTLDMDPFSWPRPFHCPYVHGVLYRAEVGGIFEMLMQIHGQQILLDTKMQLVVSAV